MNKKERKHLEDKITSAIVELLKENKIPTGAGFIKKLKKHAKAIAKKTGKVAKSVSKGLGAKKAAVKSKSSSSASIKVIPPAVKRAASKIKKQ